VLANQDKDGNYLDGAKNYKLNIPRNVPAKDFWSVVLYDPQTRSQLQTSQPFPSKNSKKDKLTTNADGSADIYFGPTAPQGKEANWIATVPNKGWFTLLRLYGPLEPWFDKTGGRGDRIGEVSRVINFRKDSIMRQDLRRRTRFRTGRHGPHAQTAPR
jgi:hypothetical protein